MDFEVYRGGHRGEGSVIYRLPEMDFEVFWGGHRGEGVSDTGFQRWTSRYSGWTQGCEGILGWTEG